MKKRFIILFVLCATVVCILSVMLLSGDWEEIMQSTAYYDPERILNDLNGTSTENMDDFSFETDFNAAEYNAVKVRCDMMIVNGEIEHISLADKNGQSIKEWISPTTSFEEELDRKTFRKLGARVNISHGSEETKGKIVVTLYGRPKLITLIKRNINYMMIQ